MQPDFSEFSYGYAVVEEILALAPAMLVGPPMFPSLRKEGVVGGYDVKIPLAGMPIFLQFKLSDLLTRRSAREHRDGLLQVPYYRMHLRPLRHSNQHNLLLQLSLAGETVFYIAPEFHLQSEFNGFYFRGTVLANSAAFSPDDIGPLPTDGRHYVSFRRGDIVAYRCSSDPKEIRKLSLMEQLDSFLAPASAATRRLGEHGIRDLINQMIAMVERERRDGPETTLRTKADLPGLRHIASGSHPLAALRYIARNLFDAEVIILDPRFVEA